MKEIFKNVRNKLAEKYLDNNSLKNSKKFKPRIKARIRKNKQIINKNIDDFFGWVKGAELVELKECNVSEDPVRPELSVTFRRSHGRKIYGVKYKKEIHAVMCFAFTNKVPINVEELDKFSQDAHLQSTHRGQNVGQIAIAYTVWSRKRGAGREIIQKVLEFAKTQGVERVVTLSPLTPMATHFHIKNGAKQISINDTTQNFEYEL